MRSLVAAAAVLVVAGCGGGAKPSSDVVRLAQERYRAAKARGVDMARGPCLGTIKPGWVADVAHDPRRPVDDDPRNQCAAFRTGKASHFVELDPNGKLIRAE